MIRSAVTVSLVEQARGGPFVFWDDLGAACAAAAGLGFDAVEIFAPSADAVDADVLRRMTAERGLGVAAVGTGAGMVVHGLSLTDPEPRRRLEAADFMRGIIDFGAAFGAPAIVGSMQGRWDGALDRPAALELLGGALRDLGAYAGERGTALIYEPLNRYETNLVNTIAEGAALLREHGAKNVKLLADLFHMNIEEADIAAVVRAGRGAIGHVHFVDSNRRAAGMGHLDFGPIAAALKEIEYDGYASAEAFPLPDSAAAAQATIAAFRRWFG